MTRHLLAFCRLPKFTGLHFARFEDRCLYLCDDLTLREVVICLDEDCHCIWRAGAWV